jgi:catechol 2,3-dioxygenase-like lactoylglutathione lyase family enzyme
VLRDAALVAFVGSRDLQVADGFYRGVLGLEAIEATSFANVYDAHGTTLRVTRVDEVVPAPYTVLGWNVPDIAAAVESLTARGLAFARYDELEQDDAGIWTAPGGARVAWFRDPDGNTLSLSQLGS